MPERILVVDDEESVVQLLSYNLRLAGFDVISAGSGEDGLALVRSQSPDLVILDVMMPGMDGFEVCRELRRTSAIAVVMLTARDDEIDRVVGFEVGADDYVVKPFSPRELVGRVKAILRRSRLGTRAPELDETLVFGSLTVNFATHEVLRNGDRVSLTPMEFQILKVLAGTPGRVFTRQELIAQVIGTDFVGDRRLVDVHVRHLRSKIEEDPAEPQLIETVRGAGYKFRKGAYNE